jgi:tetratricopeptide (TPR) repeat protein
MMMTYKALFAAALLCSAAPALAGEKVLFQPAPSWVKAAPAIEPAKIGADGPVIVMLDSQQRLEGGETWAYVDAATRAASAEMLSAVGTVQLPWQPAHGDLIFHRAEILRGNERIDVLKDGGAISVLRREQALEQRMLDGVLTATMQVEGLRVGDILRLSFSVTSKDPTLKGYAQTLAPLLAEPTQIGFGRVRLVWPKDAKLQWKAFSSGVDAAPADEGAYRELTIALPLAKPPEMPGDAPVRFQNVPMMEATTFPDWATLATVMEPLYRPEGLIASGSPLAAEAKRIKAASSDPATRAALALQLVQDEVRYQLMGMNSGNYVPQTPAETWSLRYGDCKAKTLLLLALLHELGIEAEAVLASLQLSGFVEKRLPSAAAFDHVLVRATIGGESLWLDGTGSGSRLGDLKDTPSLAHVLPLRPAGAALMPVPMRPPARPEYEVDMEIDHSAGISLPAPYKAAMILRGGSAAMLKSLSSQGNKEQTAQFVEQMIAGAAGEGALVGHTIRFDDAQAAAYVEARGITYSGWNRENRRWGFGLDTATSTLEFAPDRARPAWRDIPVSTGAPSHKYTRIRIKLPNGGEGFAIDGAPTLAEQLGGVRVERKVALADGWATAENRVLASGAEIPASEVAETRKRVAQAKARALRLLAPGSQASRFQEVEAARRAKQLQPLIAGFDARVAARPKEAQPYIERAWFHEQVFDWPKAVADLGRAIAIEPTADRLVERAGVHFELGNTAAAMADAEEALRLDPAAQQPAISLAYYKAEAGDRAGGLALLQERIDAGGKDASSYAAAKAEIEAEGGNKEAALAIIDEAVAKRPGDPSLLNTRCWLKGTMNVALDSALKDCTKAIELSDSPVAALDSRAMAYFRMNRADEALADVEAALAIAPELAASLFLRGVLRKQAGDTAAAAADLAAAKALSPRILQEYARYGIKP